MRFLFIHNNYAGNDSGEEHAANGLVKLLEVHGHTVKWYRRSSDEIANTRFGQIKAFFAGIYNPVAVREIKHLLVGFQPDVVQVQNLYPLISPAILKVIKKAGIPLVLRSPNYRLFCPNGLHLDRKGNVCEKCLSPGREIHCLLKNCENSVFKSMGYALRNYVARKIWGILKMPDVYIVQSEFQRKKFIRNGLTSDKIAIIPGLSPAIEVRDEPVLGDRISFVGRVSPEKGILEFLKAAEMFPGLPFAVAGSIEPALQYLKSKSPDNVVWHGFLKGKELDEFYRASRIIVVPGKWFEGFPNVITRAMQHAKPVIASNLGAMASIIDQGKDGLLVTPGNPSHLADAIRNLYYQPDLCRQYGENGKEKACKLYSAETIYSDLMKLYQEII